MIRKSKHLCELVANHMDSSCLHNKMGMVENITKIPANDCVADKMKSLIGLNQCKSEFEFWHPQREQNNNNFYWSLYRPTTNISHFSRTAKEHSLIVNMSWERHYSKQTFFRIYFHLLLPIPSCYINFAARQWSLRYSSLAKTSQMTFQAIKTSRQEWDII